MIQPIGIRLPKELLQRINEISKKEMEDRSRIIRKLIMMGYVQLIKDKACEEYVKGDITLSEAAKKAELTIWQMERYLIEKGYKSDYSLEELEKEIRLLD